MGAPFINPLMAQRVNAAMAARGRPNLGVLPGGLGGMPGGGMPPGLGGAPGGGAGAGLPSQLTNQINQALSGLRQSNPRQVVDMLRDMKQTAARLISITSASIPGVSRNLAATLRIFDNAIKEATTAMATEAAAGPPIANTAASIAAPAQAAPGASLGMAPGPTAAAA